jgi:hypothetical protein
MAAGLIELSDGEVHFRHPLMRAAVYNLASSDSRATGHLALAEAVGRGNDRGVLHRAQAATGSDDGLAVELELVADRAVGRGAVSAAVMTLARAAELTSSAPDKRRYLFQAAVMAYELGQADAGERAPRWRSRSLRGLPRQHRRLRSRARRRRNVTGRHRPGFRASACKLFRSPARPQG